MSKNNCPHLNVRVYSELWSIGTLEDPPEYEEWAICRDCGERLSIEDIPEDAEEEDGELDTPGIPHEFYD